MVLDSGNVITHLSLFYSPVLMAHIKQTTFLHRLVICAVPFPCRGDKPQLDIPIPVEHSSALNRPPAPARTSDLSSPSPHNLSAPSPPKQGLGEEQEEQSRPHALLGSMCFSGRSSSLALPRTEQVRIRALALDSAQKGQGLPSRARFPGIPAPQQPRRNLP